ncbi:MAG: hypothetical protein RLZZ301_1795 [Bacteroidota bacterium]
MKQTLLSLALFATSFLNAQTQGTLSITFTQTAHTSYTGNKNVLAVWVQTSTGTFVKTRARNAGGGTSDHLPTWAVNSGGSANNCMSGMCNTVGATTGATLSSFATRTYTWDGTDVSGNLVADGSYKITIESCWNHGTSAKATRSFTFTKGATADVQTPAADANFTGISLSWTPSGAGIDEVASPLEVSISPNPSTTGVFEVSFNQATSITVMNLAGQEILNLPVVNEQKKSINLAAMPNGVYFISVTDGKSTKKEKVILNR